MDRLEEQILDYDDDPGDWDDFRDDPGDRDDERNHIMGRDDDLDDDKDQTPPWEVVPPAEDDDLPF